MLMKPEHGGESCPRVQGVQDCNVGMCDRDYSLADWSNWTSCSMTCSPGAVNGPAGIKERSRSVIVPVRGNGKCPEKLHVDRYARKSCNMQACVEHEIYIVRQDLVIVLGGSGSVKRDGFEVLRGLATQLMNRYKS